MLSNDVILVTEVTWYRDRDVDVCGRDLSGHTVCFSRVCIYSVSVFIINNSSIFHYDRVNIISVVILTCTEYYHSVTKFVKCSCQNSEYICLTYIYIHL